MNEIEEKKTPQIIDLVIQENGDYDISNKDRLYRAAQAYIQQGFAPPDLAKQGPAAVSAALLMCKQFGLPQKSISQMAFINGRLTVYGTLYTALAQRDPDWREPNIFYLNKEGKEISIKNGNALDESYACVIQVPKKDGKSFNEYIYSLKDAEKAGLWSENRQSQTPWYKYTKDMLYHKCKARAYSREYARTLEGVYMKEDLEDISSTVRDINTTKDLSQTLPNQDLVRLKKGDL